MLNRLTITFEPEEREALQQIAEQDFRYPKETIRLLIRKEAQERGLWPSASQPVERVLNEEARECTPA